VDRIATAPEIGDRAVRLTPEQVLAMCHTSLENLRQATTLEELAEGISKPFHAILPHSCLSIWLWDAAKHQSCKLFSRSWADGHAAYPRLLDGANPISRLLAMKGDIDGRTLLFKIDSLGPLACARAARVAHFRITTGGLRLLVTACLPDPMETLPPKEAHLYKTLLGLMAQAAVHTLERIQLKAERDVLTGISTLANQSRHRSEFLDSAAKTIRAALSAEGCSIFLYDRATDRLTLGGTTGIFDPKTGRPLATVDYGRGEGLTGWIWQNKRPVRLTDASNAQEWLEVDPSGKLRIGTKSAEGPVQTAAPRPFLGMPIFHGEPHEDDARFVGLIRLHNKTDNVCFLPSDETLLRAVSTTIAPAILHWNAMAELQKAHGVKDSLFDIIESCYVEPNLKDILHKIVTGALRIFDAYSGCILLKDPAKDWLTVETFEGNHARRPEKIAFGFEHGLCGHCASTRQTLLVADVSKDPHYYEVLPEVRSEACTPILYQQELFGILNLDSARLGYFQADNQYQKHFLEILAKQAALAIHRQRMSQERENLYEGLIRTTELLTTTGVASGLAHELKNGLAVIAGNVSALQSGRHHQAPEILQTLKLRTDHLFTLANRLLDLTKVGDASRQRVYLNDVISASYVLLKQLIESKRMTPKLSLAAELSRPSAGKGHLVEVDDRQISLVLTNLVLNAIDASGRGKPIEISTRNEPNQEVSFSVRDYGKGIPPEARSRIFEMFFTTKKGGFGVGLHVAHELVRRHDGRIEFESKPGAGTCFTVYLPKYKDRR
jgi:signal transduction histidine kinase